LLCIPQRPYKAVRRAQEDTQTQATDLDNGRDGMHFITIIITSLHRYVLTLLHSHIFTFSHFHVFTLFAPPLHGTCALVQFNHLSRDPSLFMLDDARTSVIVLCHCANAFVRIGIILHFRIFYFKHDFLSLSLYEPTYRLRYDYVTSCCLAV
jgi:hypothetical protein